MRIDRKWQVDKQTGSLINFRVEMEKYFQSCD